MKYQFVIRGTIGSWWSGTEAQSVCDFLDSHTGKEVEIAICSPGGYVADGLEIYHAIRQHGKVNVTIIGMTASIATVLAMAAAKVKMAKQALILVHNSSTLVSEWSSCNKEKLDSIIQKLNKERADLDTIDKLIASIYADKCGKKEKDIADLMTKAAWINAENALKLGLVDEIVDTPETERESQDISNHFTNFIAQYGLPALPQTDTDINALAAVVDDKGNPAESFLQKTVQKIQDLLHISDNTANKQTSMKKNDAFKLIMACIAVESLTADDKGNITLSQQQLQAIEDKLAQEAQNVQTANSEKETAQNTVSQLQETIKQKDGEIANLKGSAPADDDTVKTFNAMPDGKLASDMFNAVKDI